MIACWYGEKQHNEDFMLLTSAFGEECVWGGISFDGRTGVILMNATASANIVNEFLEFRGV